MIKQHSNIAFKFSNTDLADRPNPGPFEAAGELGSPGPTSPLTRTVARAHEPVSRKDGKRR